MRALHPICWSVWAVLAMSCAQFRKQKAEPGAGEVPDAARAEDIAKADEFFQKGGKNGFHPAGEKTPKLTAGNCGYVVELDQQRVYLYHGSDLIAMSRLSSGRKSYRTETGTFKIGQKDLNHRSNLYGNFVATSGSLIVSDVTAGFDPVPPEGRFQGSLMKYFQRFDRPGGGSTAMGFHAGVVPTHPASHGCVRLPSAMAKWFYQNVSKGTPIVVRGTKYGVPYGSKQSRPKRKPKVHPSLQKVETEVPQTPPAGAEGAAPPSETSSPSVTTPSLSEPPTPAVPEPARPASPEAPPGGEGSSG